MLSINTELTYIILKKSSSLRILENCLAACHIINDTGAAQAWSVSFFFINLVLAIAVGSLFMSNSGPGKFSN